MIVNSGQTQLIPKVWNFQPCLNLSKLVQTCPKSDFQIQNGEIVTSLCFINTDDSQVIQFLCQRHIWNFLLDQTWSNLSKLVQTCPKSEYSSLSNFKKYYECFWKLVKLYEDYIRFFKEYSWHFIKNSVI